MTTRSLRLPDDLLVSLRLVEEREQIEEASAIRKLLRMGLETYLADLYARGKVTLREAARRLHKSQVETFDLFLERGVSGNLDAGDVLTSMQRFLPGKKP